MGMSAWGLIITPALIAADPSISDAQRETDLAAYAQTAPEEFLDPFAELTALAGVSALDDTTMSNTSGGTHTAIDIGYLGVNVAENDGQVNNVNVSNTVNGDIRDNIVSDNGGITTVFNNTGNGVVMQSIVNMNIFLQGAAASPQP